MIRPGANLCLFVLSAVGVCQTQTARGKAIQTHYERAQEALAGGQYETAAAEFSAILRIDPNRAEIHANLGTVHYAQSRYIEASAAFRKALQLKPSLKGAEAFLGMSEARQGRTDRALPLLEKKLSKSVEHPMEARVRVAACGRLPAQGRIIEATGNDRDSPARVSEE